MNWISNYVRPTINSFFSRREVPENLWTKCDSCATMLFHRELADSLNVCTNCGHHMYLAPRARFNALFDAGLFTEIAVPVPVSDPLHFRDQKRYPDRMRAAQKASGEAEAMLVAEGEIGRTPVLVAAQDFNFMAGSMGMYVGNALIAGAQRALATRRPFIVFAAAGGARMQEGILSLMQMPRSTVALQMLREEGLPYIVVLTNPTTGGVTASYAMLGDIHIAEPGALICFAGPRVIEQTIRERLPEGFQSAEYLLEHGMLDRVVHRSALREELITITRLLMRQAPAIRGELPPPGPTLPLPAPELEDGTEFHRPVSAPGSDILLARMMSLHPKIIDLTLDRVWRLLDRLGNPQDALPPVIHVAGTNGKGSTLAMVRAGLEGSGQTCHVYTSPHLVRFHERVRLAGESISEPALGAVLDECLAANGSDPITYFEITTVAAILAFARTPADWTLLEVGLGGRLDATNVVAHPRACVITPISMDHEAYLGDTIGKIAFEKAGILKRGAPCVVGPQTDAALEVIESLAGKAGAPLMAHGQHWHVWTERDRLVFQDEHGLADLPLPRLAGAHQIANAGAAVMTLRMLGIGEAGLAAAMTGADWPARMQRLRDHPFARRAPELELWLDGGHNPAAGVALAETLRAMPARETHLICGMLATKDVAGYLGPLAEVAREVQAVSIPGADATLPATETAAAARSVGLKAVTATSVTEALDRIAMKAPGARVLICGSLFLAGAVLREA